MGSSPTVILPDSCPNHRALSTRYFILSHLASICIYPTPTAQDQLSCHTRSVNSTSNPKRSTCKLQQTLRKQIKMFDKLLSPFKSKARKTTQPTQWENGPTATELAQAQMNPMSMGGMGSSSPPRKSANRQQASNNYGPQSPTRTVTVTGFFWASSGDRQSSAERSNMLDDRFRYLYILKSIKLLLPICFSAQIM
jgi:hypothetical protein